MDRDESLKFTFSVEWKEGLAALNISIPERACMEMLQEVPEDISFEHADQLIRGMTNLSPRMLQKLLESATHIKVKRLLLWFGRHLDYSWYSKLSAETVELGSGNRVVVKEGRLDRDFKITVPKHLEL